MATKQVEQRVSRVCTECGAFVEYEVGSRQIRCQHCDSGLAVENEQLVRLRCPKCGGNFFYIDGSMCGHCPYCDTSLLALTRNRLLCYIIPPKADCPIAGAKLYLLPFWRLSGLLYQWDLGARLDQEVVSVCVQETISTDGSATTSTVIRKDSGPLKKYRGRIINQYIADPGATAFGVVSLRLRADIHHMELFSEEYEKIGRVFPPILDFAQAHEQLLSSAFRLGKAEDGITRLDCQRADLVAERISILYYPFWVLEQDGQYKIWDGVNGDPESLMKPKTFSGQPQSIFYDDLKIMELVCAKCGGLLPPGNSGMVFPCVNCGAFWVASKDGLLPFSANYATSMIASQSGNKILWLPFWNLSVEISYLDRVASKVKDIRHILGGIKPRAKIEFTEDDSPLSYFVPAYGTMKAPRLDFAARDMTRMQPLLKPGIGSKDEIFNCIFSPEDAKQLGYAVWLQLVLGAAPSRIRTLRVNPKEATLWYIPFEDLGRELICLLTGLKYDKSAFRGVGH